MMQQQGHALSFFFLFLTFMTSRLGGAQAPGEWPRSVEPGLHHPALVPGYHPQISLLSTAAVAYAADLQGSD